MSEINKSNADSLWCEFCELVDAYAKYDPATNSKLEIICLYPGIKAWALHKFSHALYKNKIPFFPRFFSEISRLLTSIDIHPGAKIGRRVIMDHGIGIVVGETSIVEDDVIIYQGVTLGGTSLERSKRHPTIQRNCVLGAGSKILGNITIGEGSRIGANSVVIKDAPPHSTLVGIPAKATQSGGVRQGEELDHAKLSDPFLSRIEKLEERLAKMEKAPHVP